ncbi:phospholipase A2 inhibitor NAI-like [Discoglossus pictus]
MRSLLGFLLAFSVLAQTGNSLSCKNCFTFSALSCEGSRLNCNSGEVCTTTYMETSIGESMSPWLTRSCSAQSKCNTTSTYSTPTMKKKTSTTCCNTNDCTPPYPQLPSDSSQLNGVTCPTCMDIFSNWCYTGETMQCAGDENMCFYKTQTISGMHYK